MNYLKKRYFIKKGSFIKRDFFQKDNGRTGVMYTLDKGALKGIANTALYKTIDTFPTLNMRSFKKKQNGKYATSFPMYSIENAIMTGLQKRAVNRFKKDPKAMNIIATRRKAKSDYLYQRENKKKYFRAVKKKMPKRVQ